MKRTKTKDTSKQLAHYLALPYKYELRQNADGSWFARVVELPGCMTEGDTEKEALRMLHDAMRDWLAVALEKGRRIPQPTADSRYSGRLLVRMPKTLHRQLAERAEAEGASLNQLVVSALSRAVGEK